MMCETLPSAVRMTTFLVDPLSPTVMMSCQDEMM